MHGHATVTQPIPATCVGSPVQDLYRHQLPVLQDEEGAAADAADADAAVCLFTQILVDTSALLS
jgi:hypothetical protein